MVREKGLEPPCREALDPKSSASTNFATPAYDAEKQQLGKFTRHPPVCKIGAMKTLTPSGVSEFTPAEAVRFTQLTQPIISEFKTHGFEPIRTPVVEYFDSLEPGLTPHMIEQSVRFFDSAGHLMILRPDHTTPIARLVANRIPVQDRPIKVFYEAPVFRKKSGEHADTIELFQAGIEWIGATGAQTDADVIQLCIQTLAAIGIHHPVVDIGHPELSRHVTEAERSALIQKDYVALGYLPQRGDVSAVQSVPELNALDAHLTHLAPSATIRYNMGLIHEFSYYTGPHFEVYAPGFRQMIACGGRYDQLMGRFGSACPAVGFALNLNVILQGHHPL